MIGKKMINRADINLEYKLIKIFEYSLKYQNSFVKTEIGKREKFYT